MIPDLWYPSPHSSQEALHEDSLNRQIFQLALSVFAVSFVTALSANIE